MSRTAALLAAALCAFGQQNARLSDLKSKGIAFIDQGRFNDALNALQEVWEQDQSDPATAENLAMAYLYADHDFEKAKELAEHSIQAGGKASFLVQHPHEKVAFASGDMADYCSGRLSISREKLVYVASEERHSFVVGKGELKEIKANKVYGTDRGMYHIRTADKKNYNFRPRSWSPQEQDLILLLVNEYIK